MALEEYRRKRDFKKTPEPPPGKIKTREELSYCIQKHDATRLHYDFRLELDGVLLSWAVTRGPSLDPVDKRLAVRTEDHPLDYGGFEGTIPQGQYGGGTVMLWDEGTWEPKGDPHLGLKKGHISFVLHGGRLKGGWDLIRMRGDDKRENWLLIKERDKDAKANGKAEKFLEKENSSIKTGRSMEEIAEGVKKASGKKSAASRKDRLVAGITITHPERVLFDKSTVTKGDLAAYYAAVAPYMLKDIGGHPLSLLRCPQGTKAGKCFFQRNQGQGLGPDIIPFKWKHKGKMYEYLYIENKKALVELTQMGAIEMHPWGVRADKIDYPDRLIFDLDPAEDVPFEAVKLAAEDLRRRLEKRDLVSFLKCTGGKGLHVTVPLAEKDKWPEVKAFCAAIAAEMVADTPEAYIATMSKAKRGGKIFIDYFRNDYTATAIADYGVRARPGAPVAVPLEWKELKGLRSASQFTIDGVLKRLAKKKPDMARYRTRQRIPR